MLISYGAIISCMINNHIIVHNEISTKLVRRYEYHWSEVETKVERFQTVSDGSSGNTGTNQFLWRLCLKIQTENNISYMMPESV